RHEKPFARRLHLGGGLLLVGVLNLRQKDSLPDVGAAVSERARSPPLELARRTLHRIAVRDHALGEHRVRSVAGAELRQIDLDRARRPGAVDVPELHDSLQAQALVDLALAGESLGADRVHRKLAPFAEHARFSAGVEAVTGLLARKQRRAARTGDRTASPGA